MTKKDLIMREVTLDEKYSDGEDLGIDLISNVVDPAVKIKGVAFSNHNHKKLCFSDDIKYRIGAPVLVPGDIYRNDDEEYTLRFTVEVIEQLAKKFMSELPYKSNRVFNDEHTDVIIGEGNGKSVDVYILEAILVDTPSKKTMVQDTYGVDVPVGTFFVVQQFNDKEKFEELVANGQTGFSIEGFLGMIDMPKEEEVINKLTVNKMRKSKLSTMTKKLKFVGTKRVVMSASRKRRQKFEEVAVSEELILIADELVEGAEVVVVEDVTVGAIEDFTGEIEIAAEGSELVDVVIIEDGVIVEVVEDVESDLAPEEVTEVVEAKLAEDVVVTDTPVVVDESKTLEKLEEIYDILAEMKEEISKLKVTEVVDGETVVDAVAMRKQALANSLNSYNRK